MQPFDKDLPIYFVYQSIKPCSKVIYLLPFLGRTSCGHLTAWALGMSASAGAGASGGSENSSGLSDVRPQKSRVMSATERKHCFLIIYIYTHIYIYIYIYTYTYKYPYINKQMYIYIYICKYTYIYVIYMIQWVRWPVYLTCSVRWGGKTWKLFVKYRKLFI